MSNLAVTTSAAPSHWESPDWQRLWLAVRADKSRRWRSLALVPASSGTPNEVIAQIAIALAHTGMVHVGTQIHVADATRLRMQQMVPFTESLRAYMRESEMMVMALAPHDDSVVTQTLARQADAALLCVVLGQMRNADAKRTIAAIGAPHFLGTAVFRPPGFGGSPFVTPHHP